MLHIVNKSPFLHNNLDSALNFAKENDPILLYEDAVNAVQVGTKLESKIKTALKNNPIFALEEDLQARGISKIIEGVKLVHYGGFVDLVEKHKVMSWL